MNDADANEHTSRSELLDENRRMRRRIADLEDQLSAGRGDTVAESGIPAGASDQRFGSIVRAAPMGIHLYHLETEDRLVFLGANPAADKILGLSNAQFVGLTIEEAFPALVDTEVPQRYRLAASQAIPWTTEHISYQDERISGAYEVHTFQSSPGYAVVMFIDITQRLRDAAELERHRHQLEQLVSSRTAELSKTVERLQKANEDVLTLSGLIPICAWCKKIRDDEGYWQQVECWFGKHADVTHCLCPECKQEQLKQLSGD